MSSSMHAAPTGSPRLLHMPAHRSIPILFMALALGSCSRPPERTITTRSPEALRFYNDGVSAMERFYYAEAESLMERAMALDSTFALARARHALLHMERDDHSIVRMEMERALSDGAKATRREQLYLRAWNHLAAYRYPEEAAVLDTLTSEFPSEAEAWTGRGISFERERNIDAAIRMYSRALEADTAYARAAMLLGYAYSTAGNHERAITEMRRYIVLDPASADPRASLGDLLLRVGDYDGALEQYRASLDIRPDYWYSKQQIGTIYHTQGRLREAEEMYLMSMRKFTSDSVRQEANMLAVRAMLNQARGRYEDAVKGYRSAFALDSMNSSAAYGIVRALMEMGDYPTASGVIGNIRKELERRNLLRTNAMVSYHVLRARLEHKRGEEDQALLECDSAMAYTNQLTRAGVELQRAEILLAQGRFEEALEACDGALAVNRSYPSALLTLTKIYSAMGDRAMTLEVGGQLEKFWGGADPDFLMLKELKRILRARA